eukprot:CAMPEP_0171987546 /NCGR_PEP_ID=MMETSP0993-20121228/275444_1 /TAXON_ID=483369 /ORGANISM="non described non described, Strain CCMP2098" /LENGTH=158 /DNA_ID=CAMNT_0012640489 /DNA_START=518 /DNA_END=991 /DNA_ORIENTATION=+
MTACLSSRHIICVCVHVYGVAAKRLPKIGVGGGGGGGGGGGNLIEEEAKLPAAAVELLPAQSTAPNPNPVSLHHAVSSPLAFTMDQKYLVGVTKPWRELAAMTASSPSGLRVLEQAVLYASRSRSPSEWSLYVANLKGTAFNTWRSELECPRASLERR